MSPKVWHLHDEQSHMSLPTVLILMIWTDNSLKTDCNQNLVGSFVFHKLCLYASSSCSFSSRKHYSPGSHPTVAMTLISGSNPDRRDPYFSLSLASSIHYVKQKMSILISRTNVCWHAFVGGMVTWQWEDAMDKIFTMTVNHDKNEFTSSCCQIIGGMTMYAGYLSIA